MGLGLDWGQDGNPETLMEYNYLLLGCFEVQILGMQWFIGHACVLLVGVLRIIPIVKSHQGEQEQF